MLGTGVTLDQHVARHRNAFGKQNTSPIAKRRPARLDKHTLVLISANQHAILIPGG
jgi:hypothetical protein